MHPAELRFRSLWLRLFGPLFPAKPLKWGGKVTRAPEYALVDTGHGYQRLMWRFRGTDEQVLDALMKMSPHHATRHHV